MLNENIVSVIKKFGLVEKVQRGNFGLEKENLRVDREGHLALTPHPAVFGDKEKSLYHCGFFRKSA